MNIFQKISEMIEKKETRQKHVAEQLKITQGHLSKILRNETEPSKPLIKLAEILYSGEKQNIHNETIAGVISIMAELDEEAQKDIFRYIQKEKLLRDLIKEKQKKDGVSPI